MGGGTILRKFTTFCGTTLYFPDHGYHMPKANILLESPHYVIRAMGGSYHAIIDMCNI